MSIRVRACLAVVEAGKILLVPHYQTDAGPIQWQLPGGAVDFGETLRAAAVREFKEETGFEVVTEVLLGVYEHIQAERPWHSLTITYRGQIVGGQMQQEATPWGPRTPRWFGLDDLADVPYHPRPMIDIALDSGLDSGE